MDPRPPTVPLFPSFPQTREFTATAPNLVRVALDSRVRGNDGVQSAPARRETALINAAHLLTHYSLLILPTAVLIMARPGGAFGSEYGPILALATGMFVLYGAGALPQGWLAARVGRKAMMTVFFLGTGVSLIAAGFAGSRLVLALTLAAAGAFASIYHPIGTAMLVEAAGDKPGRALGVNGVFGNLGVASAPLLTGLLTYYLSWRAAFLLPGAVCLAVGVVWLRAPIVEQGAHRVRTAFPAIPAAMVRRAVVVLLLIAAASGLIFNAFTLLLPKLIADRLADNPGLLAMVSLAAFGVTLCGAVTQFTVGRLIDHTTVKSLLLPLAAVLAPGLAGLAWLHGWPMLLVAAVVAAVIFGQVTLNETITARYISPETRARMYSVRFFVGFLGAAVAPSLVGLLEQRTGSLVIVMLVLATVALVTLGCAVSFPDRREELQPSLWANAVPAE